MVILCYTSSSLSLLILVFITFTHLCVIAYNETERKAINKFRPTVTNYLYRDFMKKDEYLIRWIIDQNFNLQNAREKLLRSISWRKENNVDMIGQEDFSDIQKFCPFDIGNILDRIGRPVFACDIGICPVRKLVLSGKLERLQRTFTSAFEIQVLKIQKLQAEAKNITDGIVLANTHSFSWREHACVACIPFTVHLFLLYENYYPGYIYKIIIFNAPRIFENLLSIVRPLLSQHVQKTINLYSYNRDEWQHEILKLIEPNQLEQRYGGTKGTHHSLN